MNRIVPHKTVKVLQGLVIASAALLFQGCSSLKNVDEFATQYDVNSRTFGDISVDEATKAPLQAIACLAEWAITKVWESGCQC